jgi:signal peptidase I
MSRLERHRGRSVAGRLRQLNWVGSWVLLVAAMALAWPIQLGGLTGYTIVAGSSMNPTYHTGDLLITRPQDHYRPGQIVVYKVPMGAPGAGYRVVHRLVGGAGLEGGPGWVTKGDNNPSVDIWNPHDNDVHGVVVLTVAKAGFVLNQVRNPLLYAVVGALITGRLLWPTPDPDDGEGDVPDPAADPEAEVPPPGDVVVGPQWRAGR